MFRKESKIVALKQDDGQRYPAGTDLSQKGIYAKVMTITPEMAKEMLSFNSKHQRSQKKGNIANLTEAIKNDEWVTNSNSIGFDVNGNLVDGQHRLTAIVLAGKPVISVVVYNLPPEAFVTTDNGAKRAYADVAHICGFEYAKYVGGAAHLLYRYLKGSLRHLAMPTNIQIRQLLMEHPGLGRSAKAAAQTIHILQPSVGTFCHFIFSEIDADDADLFFEGVRSGAGLPMYDPILALREKMIQDKGSAAKLQQHYRIALTIKAWNAWRENKKVRLLRWSPKTKEAFPRPI